MKQQLVTIQRQSCATVEREMGAQYEELKIYQESASINLDVKENEAYAIPKEL